MDILVTFGYLILYLFLRGIRFLLTLFVLVLPEAKRNKIKLWFSSKISSLIDKEREWKVNLMFWEFLEDFIDWYDYRDIGEIKIPLFLILKGLFIISIFVLIAYLSSWIIATIFFLGAIDIIFQI